MVQFLHPPPFLKDVDMKFLVCLGISFIFLCIRLLDIAAIPWIAIIFPVTAPLWFIVAAVVALAMALVSVVLCGFFFWATTQFLD